ncbi:MAG: hypothetical protein ABIP97_11345 [Chthoniobacterales bacterium]
MNEAASPKRSRWWYIAAFGIVVFFGITWSLRPSQRDEQIVSFLHMKALASAILAYESEHSGKLPDRLSQLPAYLKDGRILYFSCGRNELFTPANADSEPRLIDIFSSYGFSPLSDGRVVIYERLPTWSDHSIGYCVITRTGETATKRVQSAEFERRYLRDFKP